MDTFAGLGVCQQRVPLLQQVEQFFAKLIEITQLRFHALELGRGGGTDRSTRGAPLIARFEYLRQFVERKTDCKGASN